VMRGVGGGGAGKGGLAAGPGAFIFANIAIMISPFLTTGDSLLVGSLVTWLPPDGEWMAPTILDGGLDTA